MLIYHASPPRRRCMDLLPAGRPCSRIAISGYPTCTGHTLPPQRPSPRQRRGFIYYVQAISGGPVKIGYTRTLKRLPGRLQAIQVGNPQRLQVIAIEPGLPDLELALHDRFGTARLAGEWFAWSPELDQWLEPITPLEAHCHWRKPKPRKPLSRNL